LKDVFKSHYQLSDSAAPTGMRGMLKRLRISLSGQHHLGMDDVTNLSKILKIIVKQSGTIEATGTANNLAGGAKSAGKAAAKAAKNGYQAPAKGGKAGKGFDFKGGKGDFKGKDGKGDFKGKDGKGDFKGGKGDFKGSKGDFKGGKGDFKSGKGAFNGKSKFTHGRPPPPPPPGAGAPPSVGGSSSPPFSKSSPDGETAGVKRPADPLPGTAAGGPAVKRREKWNPWAEGTLEPVAAVDAATADLQDFLKNAPRPGEDWEQDDDGEEEEASSKAPEIGGMLGGVLDGGATDGASAEADAPPAKAASLSSLFASLPKPTGGG